MGDVNLLAILGNLGISYVPFLFSLCFHEFAHAWMAKRKGDNTAELMGRLNMNPFAHADLVGTFLLPIGAPIMGMPFVFGWAKPVPVNSRNLRRPRQDMFWIALAGPVSNLILATVGALVLAGLVVWGGYEGEGTFPLRRMASIFVLINLMLAFFNMIPLHPLDGGKVLARFLPAGANQFLEENSHALNIGLIALFVLGGFHFLGTYVERAAGYLVISFEFLLRMAA